MQRVRVEQRIRLAALLGFGIVTTLFADNAGAVDLLVENTNDSGPGSLRQAIADNCALGGGNTIVFSNAVAGTILLTTGELLVTNDVTILGPGANVLAVNGNAVSRGFSVYGDVTVTLSGLTINNCNNSSTGGGIYLGSSTLTVSNCTISGNTAFGVGGAGIFNANGTLTVFGTTFSGNQAERGGGLFNSGSARATLIASTFCWNAATIGGGVYNNGCCSANVMLRVISCTFGYNRTGDGGSGIWNDSAGATLEIGNTILTAVPFSWNIVNSGTAISDGYNMSSDGGGGVLTNATDQINTDPMLEGLANNGGPTPTMALRVDSPAIDKGNSFGWATDQRGYPRPYAFPGSSPASGGDGSDIGAYEAGELRLTSVQQTGNDLLLSFTSWLGTNYEVQSRLDLTSGSWTPLAGSAPGNGGIVSATVSNAFDQSQQFFRIHPVP